MRRFNTIRASMGLPPDQPTTLLWMYCGMPKVKAEKSLRLFAEKVLPAVQAMPTPINPASLGQPES